MPSILAPNRLVRRLVRALACAGVMIVCGALLARPAAAQQFGATAFASDEFVAPPLPAPGPPLLPPAQSLSAPGRSVAPQPNYVYQDPWTWQVLPEGLIYHSYLAGVKEPRLGTQWVAEDRWGNFLDASLGARVGLIRYGTMDPWMAQGWELDVEGAAFPRLDMDDEGDVIGTDFRIGVPLTYGRGRWQYKLAWYHLSAHAGDELMLRDPTFERINYSRDVIVLGSSVQMTDTIRLYGEMGWAYYSDVSDPWEFQFGAEYSSTLPTGWRGSPFAAVNAQLHEEKNFGGRLSFQTGWQWRGDGPRHLLRVGLHYLTGMSPQYEFLPDNEDQIGIGLWYDF